MKTGQSYHIGFARTGEPGDWSCTLSVDCKISSTARQIKTDVGPALHLLTDLDFTVDIELPQIPLNEYMAVFSETLPDMAFSGLAFCQKVAYTFLTGVQG